MKPIEARSRLWVRSGLWMLVGLASLALASAVASCGAEGGTSGPGTVTTSKALAPAAPFGGDTIFCGGFGGIQCPAGLTCVDDPNDDCSPDCGGADCGGICVEIPAPPFCGGIAGFQCPAGSQCVDSKGDQCSPQCGGADCGGMCVQSGSGQFCGGIAGIQCPSGEICIDDSSDNCDPDCGGADCGGVCANPTVFCGGIAGFPCPTGQVCIDAQGDGCNAACGGADCGGMCVIVPTVDTGCDANADCAEGEYCAKDGCEGSGSCEPTPDICIQIFDPVCGCDGNTYSNSCYAASAGANVASQGECEEPEPVPCTKDKHCAEGEFCKRDDGACDGEGVCAPQPEACTKQYDPVCGCDGKTYGNSCMADAAGVSVALDGECPVRCKKNKDCDAGDYCFKAGCKGNGWCQPTPDACTKEFAPVCGCDGEDYGNACMAAAAGTNVESAGVCDGKCKSNDECPSYAYCMTKKAGKCGKKGTCAMRPLGCPDVWDPVCSCDGATYSNSCDAAAEGSNVDYDGECEGDGSAGLCVDANDPYYDRFEGTSFDNACQSDADCLVGGCSGEVCAAEPVFTTCEALPYGPGGSCGCVDGACVWAGCD